MKPNTEEQSSNQNAKSEISESPLWSQMLEISKDPKYPVNNEVCYKCDIAEHYTNIMQSQINMLHTMQEEERE